MESVRATVGYHCPLHNPIPVEYRAHRRARLLRKPTGATPHSRRVPRPYICAPKMVKNGGRRRAIAESIRWGDATTRSHSIQSRPTGIELLRGRARVHRSVALVDFGWPAAIPPTPKVSAAVEDKARRQGTCLSLKSGEGMVGCLGGMDQVSWGEMR